MRKLKSKRTMTLNSFDAYSGDFEQLGRVLLPFAAIMYVVIIALAVFMVVCWWKIFVKFGEPGWKALIPYYSTWIMWQYTWGNGWCMFLQLIPFAGPVFAMIQQYKLGQSFGWGTGKCVGLMFLSIVFLPMLAFGSDSYFGPAN